MAGKAKFKVSDVIEALRKTRGLVSFAAKALGCSPETVYSYARKYPKVQAAIEAERGHFVDVAEGKLMEAVQKGEPWAVALVVKTLGRKRGYVERTEQEHSGPGGGPLTIEYVNDWRKSDNPAATTPGPTGSEASGETV